MSILCLTVNQNLKQIVGDMDCYYVNLPTPYPFERSWAYYHNQFEKLKKEIILNDVNLVIAESIESVPLVFFMRQEGFFVPVIFAPHINPYPLDTFFLFFLVKILEHPEDIVLTGSKAASNAFSHLLNMHTLSIATYGIGKDYQIRDKKKCKKLLNLPRDKKIILYSGRIATDKNIEKLIDVYENVKKIRNDTLLVIAASYIEPIYYNSIALRMKDIVIFYALTKEQLINLYNAVDLYVQPATSIYEIWGRSPIEAILCGTPAVLPEWSGFKEYLTSEHGALVKVNFLEEAIRKPYGFAEVDTSDFANAVLHELNKDQRIQPNLPNWTKAAYCKDVIRQLIKDKLLSEKLTCSFSYDIELASLELTEYCQMLIDKWEVITLHDLLQKEKDLNVIARKHVGDAVFLKMLHHATFKWD